MMTRTIHDLAYNEHRDELVVPALYAQAIMTFRGAAEGDEAPIRVIRGPHTQINGVLMRLSLDPIHEEVYLPIGGEVLVFPSLAEGDVAPIRILKGPDTQLGASGAYSMAVDPVHDLMIVSGNVNGKGQVLIFNRTAEGNAKPLRAIRGPKTGLDDANGDRLIALYPPREWMVIGVPGRERNDARSFVGVWSERDNGDVPPRWTIGGPNGMLRQTRGVALDPKHKTVIVGDKYVNAVMTYYFPEIF